MAKDLSKCGRNEVGIKLIEALEKFGKDHHLFLQLGFVVRRVDGVSDFYFPLWYYQ